VTRSDGRSPAWARVAPWVALLAGAAGWRAVVWARSVTIFNDGPVFLYAAKQWYTGHWSEALAQPQHPLYPVLVALVHAAGIDWENAGAAISIAGGTAAVGFAALFYRDAFGAAAAWIAAGLLVVHSRAADFSSDVQSDGLYVGLFLAGVWLAWRAIGRRSIALAIGCGVASGLAYLTRPEGLGLAIVVALFAAGAWIARAWPLRDAVAIAAAAVLAAATVAAPYAIAISRGGEGFVLTHKKSLRAMAGMPLAPPAAPQASGAPAATPQPAAPPLPPLLALVPAHPDRGEDTYAVVRARTVPARAWAAFKMVARTEKSALRYGPLVLLAIGLVSARGRPDRRGAFVFAFAGFYTVVLYALTEQIGYVSRRHALPPLVPLFGYVGLGALALGSALARVAPRRRLAPTAFAAAIAALVGLGELASQRTPRRDEERAALAAAQWLRANRAPGPLVTDRLRLGYYAGMPYVPFVRADDAVLRSFFDRALDPARGAAGARYVLLDDPDDVAAVQRTAGDRFQVVHRTEDGGREAWVFERAPSGVP
jgi:hypothetical protein